ncbi:uncharacterized protein LOC105769575 [Gossypium raimondii]|uniref:uncharacterized protein LOC105769575 n=1 Tax=Gossypium raimondii TaxID=29730 RepID=UPI00227A411D|nr:uncharacterized protein LOC105769575 [Gossypium raimondii]
MYNLKKANAYECAIICNANYDVKIKHILIFYASNGYISYNSITDMLRPSRKLPVENLPCTHKAICDTLMESQKARIPVKEHPGHMHWTWAVAFNPEVPTQTHLLTCDWLLYILVMNQPLEAQLNHPLTGQTHYLIHPTVAL